MSKAENCPACYGTLSADDCRETFTPEERGYKEYYYLQNPEVVARTIYPTHDYVTERSKQMKPAVNVSVQFFDKDKYSIMTEGTVMDEYRNQTNLSADNLFAVVGHSVASFEKLETPNAWDNIAAKIIVTKEPKAWTLEDISNQLVLAASNLPTGVTYESTELERQHIEALANLYHITAKLALRNS